MIIYQIKYKKVKSKMKRIWIFLFLLVLITMIGLHTFRSSFENLIFDKEQNVHTTKSKRGYVGTLQSVYNNQPSFLKGLTTTRSFPPPGTFLQSFQFTKNPLNQKEYGITYEMIRYNMKQKKKHSNSAFRRQIQQDSEMIHSNDIQELSQLHVEYMDGYAIGELEIKSCDNYIFLRHKYIKLDNVEWIETKKTSQVVSEGKNLDFLNDLCIDCSLDGNDTEARIISSIRVLLETDEMGNNWFSFIYDCSQLKD